MTKRDWLLFISTFVMGVVCGGWLYLTVFVPKYVSNPVVQEFVTRPTTDWTLTVVTYGGCQPTNQCAGFSVTDRGQYRYQSTPTTKVAVGTLPQTLHQTLASQLEDPAVARLATDRDFARCRSFAGGIDYTLTLQTGPTSLTLDTCTTTLGYDSDLTAVVDDLLRFMANLDQFQSNQSGNFGG